MPKHDNICHILDMNVPIRIERIARDLEEGKYIRRPIPEQAVIKLTVADPTATAL